MKRIITVLLAFAILLTLSACGSPQAAQAEQTSVNVWVLSGPTGIGAAPLRAASEAGDGTYRFTMAGSNDEIVAAISNAQADIACVATNLAATLWNKTDGGVTVLAVNTLGVLSILSKEGSLSSIADVKGRTIYAPGQGANPEYILRYVLSGNDIDFDSDVTVRFVGDGSELLSVWQNEPDALLLAPQPVATSILLQNEGTSALDMTEQWELVSGGESTLMMGCCIVRSAFLEEHPDTVAAFLQEYAASVETAKNDVDATAALCEQYGILPKAALAKKAIPQCGLAFVSGAEMKTQLGGYLQVMFAAEPRSIGGELPADSFYYAE